MTSMQAIAASLRLLSRRDRRLLRLAVAIQMATSLLDLIGVVLLGVVGFLAASAVAGQPSSNRVVRFLSRLDFPISNTAHAVFLAGGAAALLIAKNLANPLLMARIQHFLARREALVSARLTSEALSRPLSFLQKRSSQATAIALVEGTNSAVQVVLGQAVVAASEAVLMILLVAVLVLANPAVAVGVIAFFTLVELGLHWARGNRVTQLGAQRRRATVASLTAVQEAIGTYREITVANRRMLFVNRIEELRIQAAEANAGLQVISMLPKYVSEGALILGAFTLGGVLFTTQPVAVAAGTFALVLATATRMMPSLLRFQAATLSIARAGASAVPTYQLAKELGHDPDRATDMAWPTVPPIRDFAAHIELRDVTFTYPGASAPAVNEISLVVRAGTTVALVGRSGAGKSTLADLILGVAQPDSGIVAVGGVAPADAVDRWPGGIAYVPQDVMLVEGSIRANVALGLPRDIVDDESVWEAVYGAHLEDHLRDQPLGLDTEVGERGLRLSGGQRQRLGIARALYSRPRLLVLDEATSALDAETERAVTDMLNSLHGDVTTMVIAHRLSTIRHADMVVYLDKGRVLARGTFEEVCDLVPALQRQAELMGLRPES